MTKIPLRMLCQINIQKYRALRDKEKELVKMPILTKMAPQTPIVKTKETTLKIPKEKSRM